MPKPALSSEALLAKSRAGDETAIEDLLIRYLDELRAYVRLGCGPMVRAYESTSDLVQSVCREVLRDPDRFEFRGEVAFRAWLFQAAENKIRDRVKHLLRDKRDVRRELPIEHELETGRLAAPQLYAKAFTPSELANAREISERLEAAFDRLDEGDRDVIRRIRLIGCSPAELATETGTTESSVRNRLARALEKLSALANLGT